MMNKAYNIGPLGQEVVGEFVHSNGDEALLVLLPSRAGVGEDDFLDALARERYEALGLRDAMSRHVVRRTLPHECDLMWLGAFLDEPRRTAEITDALIGVDVVDLSAWAGMDLSGPVWEAFVGQVMEGMSDSFVFVVRAEDDGSVTGMWDELSKGPFALRDVRLYPPSVEQLARAFLEAAHPGGDRVGMAELERLIGGACAGSAVTYRQVQSLARRFSRDAPTVGTQAALRNAFRR